MVLTVAAETAYMVHAVDVARVVHRLLPPFTSQVVFAGNWVVAPVALGAALAGACAGTGDADELFEEAVDISVRLDAPVCAPAPRSRGCGPRCGAPVSNGTQSASAPGSPTRAACSPIAASTRSAQSATELAARVGV